MANARSAKGLAATARGVHKSDREPGRGAGVRSAASAVASTAPSSEAPVLVSFVYVVAVAFSPLVLLLGRSDGSKELEIVLLRHELAISGGIRGGRS